MSSFAELRSAVRGRVLLPGDDGFEVATRPWNLAVPQPAAAGVVEAADADDVAALVRFARRAGVAVATQPAGHGASGAVEGAVLLRTGLLDEVRVDPAARIARVGAGVKWGRVQEEASRHGLTGLPGSSPVVSVTGYSLGGGVSWFSRAHGWAADSVTAFEVVDAEGVPARVTAESDPELFWALRGGGGDYALVTATEFRLHPAPALYGGQMLWPGAQAREVLDVFRSVTAAAPDELTVWAGLLNLPGADPMVAVHTTYLGEGAGDAGPELLRPFDAIAGRIDDNRAVLPVHELGTITAEPTDPSPGLGRAEMLTAVDDTVIDALLAEPIAPLLGVQLRHVGGALGRPSDSPHGALPEPYLLYLFGVPFSPEAAAGIPVRRSALVKALDPYVAGRKPYTFLGPDESPADVFGPESLARLRAVKRARDPQGVFRSNFPVGKD
ncbi:FAD-linked oxidase [Streptomyces sp. CNQ-509]|uniref:FAD-binding oxidoreductase n=1 Tax=Streptomyces sp. CNQ-509 TaxID=444103 RepID=UPI00062E05A7|nr:FAD-binding oxidoreductase [Streptomyces sp. CNQ-509]AKH83321.1 FAD-linked oxidase [Streptomyces sp. CNQ-509]